MSLTAAQLIDRATQNSKNTGMTAQALVDLNILLGDLCETTRLALARGLFQFNFNPSLTTLFGSGPYNLPLDFLRTSDTSGETGISKSSWYLYPSPAFPSGTPIYLVPIDLAEFDMYPQLQGQGLPEVLATDMGGPLTQRIVQTTTASLTVNSTAGTVADATNLVTGLGVAGEGITPGTTLSNVAGTAITLSAVATKTLSDASVFFGIAPVAYVYPPPVGPYPVSIRYQRKMPPIQTTSRIPWFPNEGYLIDMLSARLMDLTNDSRAQQMRANAQVELNRYLGLADDKTNRAQTVQLDPRRFGRGSSYDRARNTKNAGW